MVSLRAVLIVWMRYYDVFRRNLFYAIVTTYAEPILYVLSFGFGLGAMISDFPLANKTVTYRQFILAGLVAQVMLVQGFFEAAYGSFIRMYYQRIFKAMALTPITLSEVLWGELLWDASKGTFGAFAVLSIGVILGDIPLLGALATLPLCFLGTLLFAGIGLWFSAMAKTIEQINYPQFLLVYPMFLFCGIYYPIHILPKFAQAIAWALPLTPIISLIRALTLGLPFEPIAVPLAMGWLIFFVFISRRTMLRRLIP